MPLRSLVRFLVVFAVLGVGAASLPATAGATAQAPGSTAPAPRPHLTTPLLSARRVPDLLRAKIADQKLLKAVQDVVKDAPPTSCVAVSFRGRPILHINGGMPLEPASVNKLLTATALLQTFPPDTKLTTTAVAQAAPNGGVLDGNLWIVGGGDPILTTPGYKQAFEDQAQTVTDYDALADRIKAAGITEIRGDIVGDDSRYDNTRYVASWPDRYKKQDTVGPMSALIVNDGVTGYAQSPDKGSDKRQPGDPPVLAADTLKTLLTDRGVKVSGNPTAGKAPAGAAEIARLDPPLSDVIAEMLSWSDNTTAELLSKELGLKVNGAGTTANGIKATIDTLNAMGMPTTGLVMNDGSGLDDGNRLTCDLLDAVLDKQGPESVLAKGLPVAGQKGTLRKRMRGTVADGKVFAKTGTLTKPPVASLAGFETTKSGDTVTFVFIQNGNQTNTMLEDQLAAAIFDYPQAPGLNELGPQPVTPG